MEMLVFVRSAIVAAMCGACALSSSLSIAEEGAADLWLDDTYGKRALEWVAKENAATLETLRADPRFEERVAQASEILTAPSRLPEGRVIGDAVYDYWQERERPLGIWRRSPAEAYFNGTPEWETVIDLDALSKAEGRTWIFAGASCREARCLISLSENGKDATAIREFDLGTKSFVDGGFALPVSKSRTWWYDSDTLLVAPVLGPDSLNESDLPKTVRLWRRGTKVSEAKTLFTGDEMDAGLGVSLIRAEGTDGFVGIRRLDFERDEFYQVRTNGTLRPLPLPEKLNIKGVHEGRLMIRPKEDWTPEGTDSVIPAGALVSLPLAPLLHELRIGDVTLLYAPTEGEAIRDVVSMGDRLYLNLLRNFRSAIVELTPGRRGWSARTLPIGHDGFISSLSVRGDKLFFKKEAILEPERLVLFDPKTGRQTELYAREPAFDASDLVTELVETKDMPGVPAAYTIVRRKNIAYDGTNPTLIYAYGGYDVSITPRYEPIFGKLWLDAGGVYVHAYLRGGGERGPEGHLGAFRKNRQQPYDDMAAVMKDLHARKITSPEHTGIMGRSNGGLMVAAVMNQHPDLMNAVVVGGPLIDMLRFHLLPPGASWTAEYGDPRDRDMHLFLSTYSPLQNIEKNADYPVPLVITSTDDDRVLPGHARRYSARLAALGHESLYFEDTQGGHYWELAGGPAPGDWRLRAVARAVEFTYLWDRLGAGKE